MLYTASQAPQHSETAKGTLKSLWQKNCLSFFPCRSQWAAREGLETSQGLLQQARRYGRAGAVDHHSPVTCIVETFPVQIRPILGLDSSVESIPQQVPVFTEGSLDVDVLSQFPCWDNDDDDDDDYFSFP